MAELTNGFLGWEWLFLDRKWLACNLSPSQADLEVVCMGCIGVLEGDCPVIGSRGHSCLGGSSQIAVAW